MKAKTAIDIVLRRVRDPNGLAHSREFVLQILDYAQVIINAQTGDVVVDVDLVTKQLTPIYNLDQLLPSILHVINVRDDQTTLDRAKLRELNSFDDKWFRSSSSRHDAWTILGKTLLVLYPAKETDSSVNITGVKRPTELTNEDIDLELSNAMLDSVFDLTECILLLRQRLFDAAKSSTERIVKGVQG